MSVTTCISCDNSACKAQLHHRLMEPPQSWHLPDSWFSLIPGDTQLHTAWHFCSNECLLDWVAARIAGIDVVPPAKPEQSAAGHLITDNKLSPAQFQAARELRDGIVRHIIAAIEAFYGRYPELCIAWDFSLDAELRKETP